MISNYILPFDAKVSLEMIGGKGLNLARMYQAGFPVPPGFIVSTRAYEMFVQVTGLSATILDMMGNIPNEDIDAIEQASQFIRAQFSSHPLPDGLVEELKEVYSNLGNPPVAVRSSATAEDLPGFSFAGQQDTYLNVVGEVALKKAVVDCWSGLWTVRAIGYRTRNHIDHTSLSLAVIVQEMIHSESSGVLFTANPLSGKRNETTIDAVFGLGEALVSGQVEPDHYVIDGQGHMLSKVLGEKDKSIWSKPGGGTVTVIEQKSNTHQVLSDEKIFELCKLGNRVATLFGIPQDIEWAGVDEQLYLLQSRPITTLYPLPDGLSVEPLSILFSFGAVQGLLDPMTPLGQDMICRVFIGGAEILGYHLDVGDQHVLYEAGARLWVNMSGLVNNRIGRKLALFALEYIEPGVKQILEGLLNEGSLPVTGHPRLITFLRLFKIVLPAAGRALHTLISPVRQRDRLLRNLENWLENWRMTMATSESMSQRVTLIQQMPHDAFTFILPQFVPRFGMGMATYNLLTKIVVGLPGTQPDTRVMMRGLPNNPTTEMDLSLWHVAEEIRADRASLEYFLSTNAEHLASEYLEGHLPDAAQIPINAFMQRYGMRGLGEIDLGRLRWYEDPQPLMQTIQSYLLIDDPALAPDQVFERGRQVALSETDRMVSILRNMRGGWFLSRLARWAAKRMRILAGLREVPKFYIIQLFDLIRSALLMDGMRLVDEETLEYPEDVFFLNSSELGLLASGDRRNWKEIVSTRREKNARENLRKQVPLVLLSDGRTFYPGTPTGVIEHSPGKSNILVGNPVSPGVAEGLVRVVLDPRHVQLEPGEILVCPGTDPSWTPLFLAAGGLVMEVGGMMTHGAVVAREYGIPAVVGIQAATQRLQTGQRISVDGSTGHVQLLEN